MTVRSTMRHLASGFAHALVLPATLLAVAAFGATASQAAQIQRVVSPGGIEAWLVEEHAVPLISMSFSFHGGNSQDPAGKDGVANLMTTLFDEGAGDLDGQAFQAREEDISMQMSFEDERDHIYGEFKALSESRDQAFDLLAVAVSKPHFADEAVERMKRDVVTQLRREAKNPEAIAGLLWAKTAFPNHPYGRKADGTEAIVNGLTRSDIADFYGRVFARDGLKIGVVGDIDAKTLAPLLDKVFGSLPAKGRLTPVADVTPAAGMVRQAMDVPQTIIRFGTAGPRRNDADFLAAYLMNHILGGGSFSSWLYSEVREKRGLAYTVDTQLAPREHSGLFAGGVGTRGAKADESLTIIREQIKKMADVGPTQKELDDAKAYIIGSYALRFDTSDKIAGQLLAIQTDNLGIDYIDRRNKLVEAVTLEDVKAAAKKILSNELTVVIVGPEAN